MDCIASLKLSVCNLGRIDVLRVHDGGGVPWFYVDVTQIFESLNHMIRDWKVLKKYTASLYRYITFELTSEARPNSPEKLSPEMRPAWKKYDRYKLYEFLHRTKHSLSP